MVAHNAGYNLTMVACHVCGSGDCIPYTSKNGYELYRCGACDLVFVHPITLAPKEIYSEDYFSGASRGFGYVNYDEDKEPMRPTFLKYLALIDAYLEGAKGKLLDVGAATGYFVALAGEHGYDAQGIDISEHAANIGRAKGRRVRAGVIEDVEDEYACITMLDLIEHVPDPRALVHRAAALLERGGVLIINAPDIGSLFARMLGRRWHLISPPEHLHYFNRSNMRALLQGEGMEVVLMTTIGKRFTLKYIFKVLYRSTHIRLFDRISSFFSRPFFARVSIPINLYDNMFVIARKK